MIHTPKYNISVTYEQFKIIEDALDLYCNLGTGYILSLLDHVSLYDNISNLSISDSRSVSSILDKLTTLLYKDTVYAVAHDKVNPKIKIAYDIHFALKTQRQSDLIPLVVKSNASKVRALNARESGRLIGTEPPIDIWFKEE
jgi:hypothetical protein